MLRAGRGVHPVRNVCRGAAALWTAVRSSRHAPTSGTGCIPRPARKRRHTGRDAGIFGLDGNSPLGKCLVQDLRNGLFKRSPLIQVGHQVTDCHPWTLDFGIHAEMTGFWHLCLSTSVGAWERGTGPPRTTQVSSGLPAFGPPVGAVSNRDRTVVKTQALLSRLESAPTGSCLYKEPAGRGGVADWPDGPV